MSSARAVPPNRHSMTAGPPRVNRRLRDFRFIPIERIGSYLTEELLRLGHRVTLFVGGASATSLQCSMRPARGVTPAAREIRFDHPKLPGVLDRLHVRGGG